MKNKRAVPLAAVAALFLSAIFTAMYINASSKKELNRALEQQREMTVLTGEFLQIKKRVESIEIRKDLKKIDGIVHAIDEVFAPIG
ncbi:MAG: hypothetical protein L0Y62_02315, partial [Nitrospirae bacterium]|nr:hypothetical protein [Nitrospirota bacterium]